MYYLYILISESSAQYYVGISSNVQKRLDEHNNSEGLTFTSKFRPWRIEAVFECAETLGEARKIENFIKGQKSKILLMRMIEGEQLSGILAELIRVPHVRD